MSFVNYLINGVSLGSVYAIIALGYTMVYGIAKMLNFAHGDVIMIGSYVVFVATGSMGLPPLAGVLLAVVVCTVLGVVIERVAYKPLRAASPLAVLITAIGVSYLLQNLALLIFGADTKSFQSVVTLPALRLADGQLTVTGETIVTIITCIIIMAGLVIFINRSKAGQAMLAVSEDKGAATLMGINVNGTIALTFAIGSALAAIAGVLLCSAYPSLTPYTGSYARHQSFRGCRIWRDWLHTGSIYRRNPSGSDRNFVKGIYFFPVIRCHCVLCSDRCTACEAHRYSWKTDQRESVGVPV